MKIDIPDEQAKAVYETLSTQFLTGDALTFVRALGVAVQSIDEPEEATVVETLTLQQRLYSWQLCNFGEAKIELLKLGICEEVGELCHAVLKHEQGIRGFDDEAYYIEQASDAIADATIYLMQLCSALGLPFAALGGYSMDSMIEAAFECHVAAGELAVDCEPEYKITAMILSLSTAAKTLGVDYESTVNRVAEQVMKRDWTK